MTQEIKFVDGMFYNEPRESAPEFVMANMSFDKIKFGEWLLMQETDAKGYVKVDVLRSKAGKPYLKVNDFKPKAKEEGGLPNPKADMPF